MNKQQKTRIGIIAAVLVVAIVAVVMVTVGGSTSAYDRHMEFAQQYLDDLQYEQAIAEYKAAIEIEPNNKEAYLALADIYVQQGDYEAALAILNQGLERTEAEELKAWAEEVSKQYEEAQALQAEQARKEEQLAREAEEARKKEEEERAREEAEKEKEAEYSRHMENAEQYIAEEDYEQALREYEAALELYPDREEVYSAMAEVYVLVEDFEAAIEVLNQGIERAENEKLEVRLLELEEQYSEIQQGRAASIEKNEANENIEGNRQEITYYDGWDCYSIDEYDGNGNLVKQTLYYESGEVLCITVYEYDRSGNSVGTVYNKNGVISDIQEYGKNGYLVKWTSYYESGAIWFIYEYDENGNRVKETTYFENGAIVCIDEYDTSGNKIRTTYYDEDGTIHVIEEF